LAAVRTVVEPSGNRQVNSIPLARMEWSFDAVDRGRREEGVGRGERMVPGRGGAVWQYSLARSMRRNERHWAKPTIWSTRLAVGWREASHIE
jgi:hypothetical protein